MKTHNKLSGLPLFSALLVIIALSFLSTKSHSQNANPPAPNPAIQLQYQQPGAPTQPQTGYPAPPATAPPAPAIPPQKYTSPITPSVKRPPSDSLHQTNGDTLTPRAKPNPPSTTPPPPHLN